MPAGTVLQDCEDNVKALQPGISLLVTSIGVFETCNSQQMASGACMLTWQQQYMHDPSIGTSNTVHSFLC